VVKIENENIDESVSVSLLMSKIPPVYFY